MRPQSPEALGNKLARQVKSSGNGTAAVSPAQGGHGGTCCHMELEAFVMRPYTQERLKTIGAEGERGWRGLPEGSEEG